MHNDTHAHTPANADHGHEHHRDHTHSHDHHQKHAHKQGEGHVFGQHDDPQKFLNKIAYLDSNLRKTLLPPEDILALLPLQDTSVVLDAGSGTGYLTIPAAKLTHNTVHAVDLDERMLGVVEGKMREEGLTNIQLLQESIDALPLPDNSVDIIMVSMILHEVPSLSQALSELSRVLTSEGHLLCIDFEKMVSSVKGPPLEIRIPEKRMRQELELVGLSVQQSVIPSEAVYILVAQKLT